MFFAAAERDPTREREKERERGTRRDTNAPPNNQVVRGISGTRAADDDSVLCLRDRTPLGKVWEVFGPVRHPHYVIRCRASDAVAVARLARALLRSFS